MQKTTPEPHYFIDYCFKTRAGTLDVQEFSFCEKPFFKKLAIMRNKFTTHFIDMNLVFVHRFGYTL